ncbi:HNH endonuclease signature motif containing protein [soil metagenome]
MTTDSAKLETARGLLAAVSPLAWGVLSDDQLCARLDGVERVGRLVDALRVMGAAEVDHRSRRSLGTEGLAYRSGHRRVVHYLEKILRISQGEAARRLRIGRDLRPREALDGASLPPQFPHVVAALANGDLDIDAAYAITKNLGQALETARPDVVADAEEQLVLEAQHVSTDAVAIQAIVWREALDPDGIVPRLDKLHEKRRFVIGRESVDGLTPFSGLAEPLFAATLRAAIGERTSPARQPRFLDEADASCDAPTEEFTFAGAGRTREQRAYDVLQGLLTAGIRADRDTTGSLHSTASVTVIVRASDLVAGSGPAWLDDVREPISAALAAAIACDSGTQLIGVDDNGQPLWLGRRERYFTPAQRKALAARDGGCVAPGCGAPASWTHAHHVIPWSEDGPTDIDNGVLLCAFHHRMIHRGEFKLRMTRGQPELQAPRWMDPDQLWRPVGAARWKHAA